jgi:ABC-type branched-subunit amino acid transport system ATPase component
VLTLSGVVAGYGGGDVLRGVDLSCERESITCIVGPNGAGKSTVLRVVSGLLPVRAGTIHLDGEPIGSLSPAGILGRGIAQVPQSRALFPSMSVHENVLMGGYLIRRDRALLRTRLAAVEELLPLVRERHAEPAGNLSGGQRRLVEIARCLMLAPRVIMLDEPSLGLDPRGLAAVTALIGRMNEAGTTILLVEQNVRLGLGLATHGVVMEGGRVRLCGPAAEVAANPEIASLYLGGTTQTSGVAQDA